MHPYPKKVIVNKVATDHYKDGGTAMHKVLNPEEVGYNELYQDYRMGSTSQGKWFDAYPGRGSEVIASFIEFR